MLIETAKRCFCIAGTGLLFSSTAQATVCIVNSFDVGGCSKGDDLLYIPAVINERRVVEFTGLNCDLGRSVMWNNTGVSCTYSGPKKQVLGSDELVRKSYAALFRSVVSDPRGWTAMGNGTYWRIRKQGTGNPLKVGDTVSVLENKCWHDIDGTEYPDQEKVANRFKLTSSHDLLRLRPNYGAVLELVSERSHIIARVEKASLGAKQGT